MNPLKAHMPQQPWPPQAHYHHGPLLHHHLPSSPQSSRPKDATTLSSCTTLSPSCLSCSSKSNQPANNLPILSKSMNTTHSMLPSYRVSVQEFLVIVQMIRALKFPACSTDFPFPHVFLFWFFVVCILWGWFFGGEGLSGWTAMCQDWTVRRQGFERRKCIAE